MDFTNSFLSRGKDASRLMSNAVSATKPVKTPLVRRVPEKRVMPAKAPEKLQEPPVILEATVVDEVPVRKPVKGRFPDFFRDVAGIAGAKMRMAPKEASAWLAQFGDGRGLMEQDYIGCYIFLVFDEGNLSWDLSAYDDIYIGQSKRVKHRVRTHLTGRSGCNADIYADFTRTNRQVFVTTCSCGENRLNMVERLLIRHYRANESYNRTRGNKGY